MTIEQFHEKLLESFKTANHNIINRICGIIIDDKMFPNLITVDKPYLERENRTEMVSKEGDIYSIDRNR